MSTLLGGSPPSQSSDCSEGSFLLKGETEMRKFEVKLVVKVKDEKWINEENVEHQVLEDILYGDVLSVTTAEVKEIKCS